MEYLAYAIPRIRIQNQKSLVPFPKTHRDTHLLRPGRPHESQSMTPGKLEPSMAQDAHSGTFCPLGHPPSPRKPQAYKPPTPVAVKAHLARSAPLESKAKTPIAQERPRERFSIHGSRRRFRAGPAGARPPQGHPRLTVPLREHRCLRPPPLRQRSRTATLLGRRHQGSRCRPPR